MRTLKLFEEKINSDVKECGGLIFRGYSSTYYDPINKKIERKEGIKLLRKKSCQGCEKCGFFFDTMPDIIDSDSLIFPKEGIINDKLYSLIVTNEQKDWESGIIDEWDCEIVKINTKSTADIDKNQLALPLKYRRLKNSITEMETANEGVDHNR